MQATWRTLFQKKVWDQADLDKAPGWRPRTGSAASPPRQRSAGRACSGPEVPELFRNHDILSDMRQTVRVFLGFASDWDAEVPTQQRAAPTTGGRCGPCGREAG